MSYNIICVYLLERGLVAIVCLSKSSQLFCSDHVSFYRKNKINFKYISKKRQRLPIFFFFLRGSAINLKNERNDYLSFISGVPVRLKVGWEVTAASGGFDTMHAEVSSGWRNGA